MMFNNLDDLKNIADEIVKQEKRSDEFRDHLLNCYDDNEIDYNRNEYIKDKRATKRDVVILYNHVFGALQIISERNEKFRKLVLLLLLLILGIQLIAVM